MENELLKTKEQNERLKKLLIEASNNLRLWNMGGFTAMPGSDAFRKKQLIERIEKELAL